MSAYAIAADRHRPQDPALIAREVNRLAAQGLLPADIERALRLDAVTVREALANRRKAA